MRKYCILSQTLKYFALSLWGLAATLSSATAAPVPSITPLETTTSPASPRTVPPDASPCVPTGQVLRTELIGSSIYQGKVYYLIAAYNSGGFPSDLVIATQKERCQRLYYNPSGQNAPFSSNVPEPVAKQLNSQRPQY